MRFYQYGGNYGPRQYNWKDYEEKQQQLRRGLFNSIKLCFALMMMSSILHYYAFEDRIRDHQEMQEKSRRLAQGARDRQEAARVAMERDRDTYFQQLEEQQRRYEQSRRSVYRSDTNSMDS